jgi:hypothetical protein
LQKLTNPNCSLPNVREAKTRDQNPTNDLQQDNTGQSARDADVQWPGELEVQPRFDTLPYSNEAGTTWLTDLGAKPKAKSCHESFDCRPLGRQLLNRNVKA